MKQLKNLFFLAILSCSISSLSAQKIGPGVAIQLDGGNFGLGAQGLFSITDDIDIAPAVTYYFTENVAQVSTSIIIVEADGHYNFGISDNLTLHPLVGLSYLSVSANVGGFKVSTGTFALNLGGGVILNKEEKLSYFGKLKLTTANGGGGLTIFGGLYFSL